MELTIIDWTIKLQIQLEEMSDEELKTFMKGKAIKYDGKLYGFEKKETKDVQ